LIASLIAKVGLRYLFPAVLLIGLAAGGWIGWKLQAGRVASAKADIAELEGRIETGRLAAAASAKHAELIISALQTDLAQAWRMREVERVEIVREIKSVSSPDRVCLGPDARRVLHGTAS